MSPESPASPEPKESQERAATKTERKGRDYLAGLRFRHYTPRDKSLQRYCEEVQDSRDIQRDIEAEYDAILHQAATKFGSAALDIENLVPKKANWDLKRAIAPKLEKLEQRTQRTIIELANAKAAEKSMEDRLGPGFARNVAKLEMPVEDSDED